MRSLTNADLQVIDNALRIAIAAYRSDAERMAVNGAGEFAEHFTRAADQATSVLACITEEQVRRAPDGPST